MARWLIVVGDTVVNIVESLLTPIPGESETAFLAVTGAESVGDNLLLVPWYVKQKKQAALDAFLDANFDFKAFIRAGTVSNLTGAQVGTFIASSSNNYRSIKASIAAASTVAAVNAINVTTGWPANP